MKVIDAIRQVLNEPTPALTYSKLIDMVFNVRHKDLGAYDPIDADELEQIKQLAIGFGSDIRYQVCSVITNTINADNSSFNIKYRSSLLNYFENDTSVIPPKDVVKCSHCNSAFTTKQSLNVHLKKAHTQAMTGTYTVGSAAHLWEIILPQMIPGKLQIIVDGESLTRYFAVPEYTDFDAAIANKFNLDVLNRIDCHVKLVFGSEVYQQLYIRETPAVSHAKSIMRNTKARNDIIKIANAAKLTDKEVFEQTVMLLVQTYQINKGDK